MPSTLPLASHLCPISHYVTDGGRIASRFAILLAGSAMR
jgi:hypothetical protein